MKRATVANKVTIEGIGLHSGESVSMVIHPAPVHSGITFFRHGEWISFISNNIHESKLATVLGTEPNTISTTEHFMSLVYALGITDLNIEVFGSELPILDGSAIKFYEKIMEVGLFLYDVDQEYILIKEDLMVRDGDAYIKIIPSPEAIIRFRINFDHPLIGDQNFELKFTSSSFVHHIASARTFGFMKDYERLKAAGYARGATLENIIVLDDEKILNESGLRFDYEFVRHKILDLVGDLSLLGRPFLGKIEANLSGHALNLEIVKKIQKSVYIS